MADRILVTGDVGFVGIHACKELARAGFSCVANKDLRRGNAWSVRWRPLGDRDVLLAAMRGHEVKAVMHFAAYAHVAGPSIYFWNNIVASLTVLDAMAKLQIEPLGISSGCTAYSVPAAQLITEGMPLRPINPYGASKAMMEDCVRWYGASRKIRAVALRYFNADGSDPDGDIGEAHDPEPHLIPQIIAAALGQRATITVNGTDYDTPDGAAVRDYVHVGDLARAHVLALRRLLDGAPRDVFNLGTGQGHSILQVIDALARAAGQIPAVVLGLCRPGDPSAHVAYVSHRRDVLGWHLQRSSLGEIARDTVAWCRARADPAVAAWA